MDKMEENQIEIEIRNHTFVDQDYSRPYSFFLFKKLSTLRDADLYLIGECK